MAGRIGLFFFYPQNFFQLCPRDSARPQQHCLAAGEIHDGGLDAHLARPPVQYHFGFQFFANVRGGGRTDVAEQVCRRRSHPAAELSQQLLCDRVRRHAQADAVLASGDEVSGPGRALQDHGQRTGPEARGELPRGIRHLARPFEGARGICKMNDDGMIGGPAFRRVQPRNRCGAGSIGAQAVNRFGWESNEAAGAQDFRCAADLGTQSLSGAAFNTASVCLALNSDNFLFKPESESARSATAKSAAFAAPASPMAKVATGIPFGICTVESSDSIPFICLDSISTPSTGSVVCAATTPARCAAPPAAAMMTFMPLPAAPSVQAATAFGVRCADIAFAS